MKHITHRPPADRVKPRRRRMKRWVRRSLLAGATACAAALAVFGAVRLWGGGSPPQPVQPKPGGYTAEGYVFPAGDPSLVLLNQNLPRPEAAVPALAPAGDGGQQLTPEAARACTLLMQAAKADGVELLLLSGWRSPETEEKLTRLYLDAAQTQGDSPAKAAQKAQTILDVPGASEHQTGLAADFASADHPRRDAAFAETDAFVWLCENAPAYGFIQRYPADRQAATGLAARPWHWRYVGPENAAAIAESGLTLEEFLALHTALSH